MRFAGGASDEGPSIEFWENRLEQPVQRLVEDARTRDYMERWIGKRKPAEVAMLRHLLGLPADAPLRDRKSELKDRADDLRRFVLPAAFALRKSMHAAVDVASGCLDTGDLEAAREADGSYSTAALIFAIHDRTWPDLENVFHLDKLHKSGFARLRLPRPPRRPARKLRDFLNSGELLAVLRHHDADFGDRNTSELQQVIGLRDALLVFIRRPHQNGFVLTENRIVHGFTPDQIVLEFRDEAALLNIASHGQAVSYEIANRIASAFYGETCEYENITEETFAAQLIRFLRLLVTDQAHDLRLVQLRVDPSPLEGAPVLDLSDPQDRSIGRAINQLEVAFGWSVDNVDRVPRLKVWFNKKRVALEIEAASSGTGEDRRYVVRYRDQTLSLTERPIFEHLMQHDHGIKIVSTEKRGARGRHA